MAKCVKCGKKGLFLKVDARGLCADCARDQLESLFLLANSGPGRTFAGDVPRGLSEQSVRKMLSDALDNSLRIVMDSGRIINESSYPPTFYERADLMRSHIDYLVSAYGVDASIFRTVSPVQLRDEFMRSLPVDEEKMWRRFFDQTMDRAVNLKTERGKQSAIAKFFDLATQYDGVMGDRAQKAIQNFKKRLDMK